MELLEHRRVAYGARGFHVASLWSAAFSFQLSAVSFSWNGVPVFRWLTVYSPGVGQSRDPLGGFAVAAADS
jgi:hypothetical protein